MFIDDLANERSECFLSDGINLWSFFLFSVEVYIRGKATVFCVTDHPIFFFFCFFCIISDRASCSLVLKSSLLSVKMKDIRFLLLGKS